MECPICEETSFSEQMTCRSADCPLPENAYKKPLNWETIVSSGGGTKWERVDRLKIPGGHLLRWGKCEYTGINETTEWYAVTFVKD